MMKIYQNYLFDLYGTLLDVHTDEENPLLWQRMSIFLGMEGVQINAKALKELYFTQVSARETQAKLVLGHGAEIDIAPVFASIYEEGGLCADMSQIARVAQMFRIFSLEKLQLFPGTLQLLQKLKNEGKRVYLLSNAQALFTLPELRALDLEQYFDGIVISSSEGIKKPDQRLYKRILERYHLDPCQTVMVGNDDQADCWGAANAGLDSMYIFTEQSPTRTNPLPCNCRILGRIEDVL